MRDDEINLDEEFPLGDGTAEGEAVVVCPYCSQVVSITLDPGSGTVQRYVEDCEVCCNPWQVNVRFVGGSATVEISALEE
jgi:hypothetical protein